MLDIFDKWKEYGVKLEKIEANKDPTTKSIYFISVPFMSYIIDDMGNELSGMLLAKRVKRELGDTCQLRCRVRTENWTAARAANADYVPPKKEQPKPNYDFNDLGDLNDIFGSFFGGRYGR